MSKAQAALLVVAWVGTQMLVNQNNQGVHTVAVPLYENSYTTVLGLPHQHKLACSHGVAATPTACWCYQSLTHGKQGPGSRTL